ncbi:SKA1 protein, partial [Alectura lathami]|nr:SKA1 protein [Alectura lathami]
SSDLEALQLHIDMKISAIKKILQLRSIGQEPCFQSMLGRIGCEMILLQDLLNKMEMQVQQQEKLNNSLKKLKKTAERDENEARHLLQNIPLHLPKPTPRGITGPTVPREEETKVTEPNHAKKHTKEPRFIKEASLLTAKEFESVPSYMKGRLLCPQINAVIEDMNKAVVAKYKIMHQPLNSMSAPDRRHYHKFLQEETEETKGQFFIVEDDIKGFTRLKMDKRFHNILNILRHCHRVRMVRSARIIRYIIC